MEQPYDGLDLFLRRCRGNPHDLVWMLDHEYQIKRAIMDGLSRPFLFHNVWSLMEHAVPFLVVQHSRGDGSWQTIFLETASTLLNLADREKLMEFWGWFGELSLKQGAHLMARAQFENARVLAQKDAFDEMLVVALTGIFRLQWFEPKLDELNQLIPVARAAARRVNDPTLTGRLYTAIASAMLRAYETELALGYAQTALAISLRAQDNLGVALAAQASAHAINLACVRKGTTSGQQAAPDLLNLVWERFSESDTTSVYALSCYTRANGLSLLGQIDEAAGWLERSLRNARAIQIPQLIVVALHALGVCYAHLGRIDEANNALTEAEILWGRLGNLFEAANLTAARANLEELAGNVGEARALYENCMMQCEALPQTEALRHLMLFCRKEVSRIDGGYGVKLATV